MGFFVILTIFSYLYSFSVIIKGRNVKENSLYIKNHLSKARLQHRGQKGYAEKNTVEKKG